MNSYKEMYFYLFNRITDISRQLEKMQQMCEEIYLELGEPGESPTREPFAAVNGMRGE